MFGRIFNIQRFSVHDGPGIRTTFFLKGCPLRCAWCHNPEGLLTRCQIQFNRPKCIHCGRCGGKAEQLAGQEINRALKAYITNCPTGALAACGLFITPDEVLKEALKDLDFYGDSGGVTFSGGEALMQIDFLEETLKRLKNAGIKAAIDSGGYVPWEYFERTIPFCQVYLYDIKAVDDDIHFKWTKRHNKLILDNFLKLCALNVPLWVRVPVIGGVNANLDEMARIADFITQAGDSVKQVTLLPYNELGTVKYETLGLQPPDPRLFSVENEQLKLFQEVFERRNILLV